MKNYHVFTVKYFGATNSRGSRVKIHSERFLQSVFISVDYAKNDIADMAEEYLTSHGFKIVGQGEAKGYCILISETFEQLK